ncbi:hypothetical protein GCM10010394_62100 [Streptomyces crystallinus]|uniref:Uncharacterized protein n=1 Tax=Streptomyces crystallinus TaxID=68191 RepID=A0ABP3S0W4_9ACTN
MLGQVPRGERTEPFQQIERLRFGGSQALPFGYRGVEHHRDAAVFARHVEKVFDRLGAVGSEAVVHGGESSKAISSPKRKNGQNLSMRAKSVERLGYGAVPQVNS